MSDESGNLYKRMAAAMGDLQRIPKNGHNSHFNYQYATAEDVKGAVRAACAKHGIAFLVEMVDYKHEGKRTTVHLRYTFGCESGESVSRDWWGIADDSQDKGLTKAVTSATKYFLINTFQLDTGDEPDPDQGGPIEVVEETPPAARPSPQWVLDFLDAAEGLGYTDEELRDKMAELGFSKGIPRDDEKRKMLLSNLADARQPEPAF